MTANRWWVRTIARWLARVDGVSGQLRLAMLGLTGLSTATLTLKQYGHGDLAWPLIGTVGAVSLVYTYYYTEGGVWNQVSRDRQDLSSNFAGPSMLMDDVTIGVAVFYAVNNRAPTAEERRELAAAVGEQWSEFREGVDLENHE